MVAMTLNPYRGIFTHSLSRTHQPTFWTVPGTVGSRDRLSSSYTEGVPMIPVEMKGKKPLCRESNTRNPGLGKESLTTELFPVFILQE